MNTDKAKQEGAKKMGWEEKFFLKKKFFIKKNFYSHPIFGLHLAYPRLSAQIRGKSRAYKAASSALKVGLGRMAAATLAGSG
ncbi:MAG: hypothetical protein K0M64_05620, partial [Rhizobium sp.]|nr:hypothetical protein [Rhizobium sp.]